MPQLSIDDIESDTKIPSPKQAAKPEDTGWSPGAKALIGAGVAAGSLALPLLTRGRAKPWAVPETEAFARSMRARGISPSIADLAPDMGSMRRLDPSEEAAYRAPWLTRFQREAEDVGEPTAVALRRRQRAQFEGAKQDTLTGLEPPMYRPGSLGQEITFRLEQEHGRRRKDVDQLWTDLRDTAANLGSYGKLKNVVPQRTYAAVKELVDTYPGVLSEIKNAKVRDALEVIARADPNDLGKGIPFIYSPAVHGPKLPPGSPPASRAGFEDLRRHIGAAQRAFSGKPETADQARLLGRVQGAIYGDLADWGAASGNRRIKKLSEDAINEYKRQIVPYKESDEASRILRGQVTEENIPGTVLRQPSIATEFAPLMGPGGRDVLGYGAAQRAIGVPGIGPGERPAALARRMGQHEPLLRSLLDPQAYQEVAPLARIAATLPSNLPTDTLQLSSVLRHPVGFLASKLPGSGMVSRAMYSPGFQNFVFRETDPWAKWLGRGGAGVGTGVAGSGVLDWLGQGGEGEE